MENSLKRTNMNRLKQYIEQHLGSFGKVDLGVFFILFIITMLFVLTIIKNI